MPYPPGAFPGDLSATSSTIDYVVPAQASFATSASGRKMNKPLHPNMRPVPGLNFAPTTYKTGRIYNLPYAADANPGTATKYAFNFLYNPNTITENVQINWDINYDSRDQFATLPNAQTIEFELMLNRISDVADKRKEYAVPTGTLHDIEYLYRCINGDPVAVPGMGNTSNLGFLIPTRLQVIFGSKYKFTGYINSMSVTHAMFQKDMVPVYTTVDISMSRALDAGGATGTADSTMAADSPGGSTYNSQVPAAAR